MTDQEKDFRNNCNPACPYFPDMSCDNWDIDENGIKRRKYKKTFKCLYDLKPIDWNRECPRITLKDIELDGEDSYEYI